MSEILLDHMAMLIYMQKEKCFIMNNMYNSLHPSLDWIGLEIFNIKNIYFLNQNIYLFIWINYVFGLYHIYTIFQFDP